ncbi:hypothetical protein J6590_057505 [Homalodisca vitripennis]|nr:hypothetical protein J6590_057505 [Homalodisca vitripennis]
MFAANVSSPRIRRMALRALFFFPNPRRHTHLPIEGRQGDKHLLMRRGNGDMKVVDCGQNELGPTSISKVATTIISISNITNNVVTERTWPNQHHNMMNNVTMSEVLPLYLVRHGNRLNTGRLNLVFFYK